jgi:hypothetical protein
VSRIIERVSKGLAGPDAKPPRLHAPPVPDDAPPVVDVAVTAVRRVNRAAAGGDEVGDEVLLAGVGDGGLSGAASDVVPVTGAMRRFSRSVGRMQRRNVRGQKGYYKSWDSRNRIAEDDVIEEAPEEEEADAEDDVIEEAPEEEEADALVDGTTQLVLDGMMEAEASVKAAASR